MIDKKCRGKVIEKGKMEWKRCEYLTDTISQAIEQSDREEQGQCGVASTAGHRDTQLMEMMSLIEANTDISRDEHGQQ
ncbi:hypothetical protein WR25_07155 [Diploscapter pachys]|uniref:Uncharacterized protein n=1 Tax=Diploscapter pachys TaxID=2018661 RepID=A0A2A2J2L7_9BILA|nr:hypothetical protein WR25_07155 [Diploscapter pachys]